MTVDSSSSSDTSTPKSNHRSSKEQHDSRRPVKSASAQKKKRLSWIQDNEDEESDDDRDGREGRKTDRRGCTEKSHNDEKASKKRGSPGAYKMKYLTGSGRTPFSSATASAPYLSTLISLTCQNMMRPRIPITIWKFLKNSCGSGQLKAQSSKDYLQPR